MTCQGGIQEILGNDIHRLGGCCRVLGGMLHHMTGDEVVSLASQCNHRGEDSYIMKEEILQTPHKDSQDGWCGRYLWKDKFLCCVQCL
jgi:hypothetical protein